MLKLRFKVLQFCASITLSFLQTGNLGSIQPRQPTKMPPLLQVKSHWGINQNSFEKWLFSNKSCIFREVSSVLGLELLIYKMR